jgi:hypothetical protein
MDDVYCCTRGADSCVVRYLGSRYRTCLWYVLLEHQTGVIREVSGERTAGGSCKLDRIVYG